jgi:hypothetical protein
MVLRPRWFPDLRHGQHLHVCIDLYLTSYSDLGAALALCSRSIATDC